MTVITKKSNIRVLLGACLKAYQSDGLDSCISKLNQLILSQRVKFPLLEFCAVEFYSNIPRHDHISFCDQIQHLKTEGGNVIIGKLLQQNLKNDSKQSFEKATEYIADADIWYVCDIIGERVFGYSLLHQPEITIPVVQKLSNHPSNWVIRSLGAGIHYSIKKGLDKQNVNTLFQLLLSMANTKDKEIRQGIGWAAKTTARFHPEIIDQFETEIHNTEKVANWFRTKISIGLNRNNYAQRD
mgnify:CR=1 FL=1